jgi:hypothetical protein
MALAPDGHSFAAGACWASSWRDFLTERVNAMGNLTGLSSASVVVHFHALMHAPATSRLSD